MYLKKYQQRVISEIKEFLKVAKETKTSFDIAMEALPEDMRDSLNYVQKTHDKLKLPYTDSCKNGFDKFYPRVNLKIPTGGGKTILAVEAIKEYQTIFAQKKTGLVVWIVPKEIIYKQTVERLRDKGHPYRQLLDQASGGRTIIAEKGQKLSKQDIEENLVILFIMAQSVSRTNSEDSLKVFKDSGGFDSFFPEDNRYDLHYQWWQQVPNLDVMWNNGEQAQLITSLGNAVRVSKPFIIIDEFHKVFTPLAKKTIDGLNPEFILGLTATPKDGMNNLCKVTGLELKDEEMVKLDLHIIPPVGNVENDWKGMLQNLVTKRNQLEQKAIEYKQETGQYIRPIALIQCERTGKDQRGNGFVHSEDVKQQLIDEGINPSEVAIKSSDKNDIAPGNITVVVIEKIRNKNAVNPLQPKTSRGTLQEIKTFLLDYISPFVEVFVQNPIYEEIQVDFKVKFKQGFDPGFYTLKLNEEIKQFLSPWAYEEGKDIVFGNVIYKSAIYYFIEKREYVDFLMDFKMIHIKPNWGIGCMEILDDFYVGANDSLFDVDKAEPKTSRSILVSASDHIIGIIGNDFSCK